MTKKELHKLVKKELAKYKKWHRIAQKSTHYGNPHETADLSYLKGQWHAYHYIKSVLDYYEYGEKHP